MNEIQRMKEQLTQHFPNAKISLDSPISENGVWMMDIFLTNYHLAIAWQKDKGFGLVSNDNHGYGEGADEVYKDYGEALSRIVQLVTFKMSTRTN